MRLFELSEQVEAAINASVDPETGVIDDAALAQLESLELARDEKALAVASYLLGCEAEADAIEATAKRLMDRARVHRNQGARLRAYIADNIPAGSKISDDRVAISFRKSQAVEVTDESKLDESFWRVRREVAKSEIRDALKAGTEVAGAHLVTRWGLTIK